MKKRSKTQPLLFKTFPGGGGDFSYQLSVISYQLLVVSYQLLVTAYFEQIMYRVNGENLVVRASCPRWVYLIESQSAVYQVRLSI
ncbi:MAG: hypothetical protein F6K17_39300 [Okeania sp. SIO3C4]|nr:hypothetical protein [Okeania sp. SIO3C4]